MLSNAKIRRTLTVLTGLAALGAASGAQATSCGITGAYFGTTTYIYDPFNETGLVKIPITLTMTRYHDPGGGKSSIINMFLSAKDTSADGSVIVPISATGDVSFAGLGSNIFYDYGKRPNMQPTATTLPNGSNWFFRVDFTGNNQASNTFTVNFEVTLPQNINLSATKELSYKAEYSCLTTGAGGRTDITDSIEKAIVFPIKVLSALRASYAGPDLDFGEIGTVPANPGNVSRSGNVWVQSSGAYSVELKSENRYRMHRSGAATDNDKINYSVSFLGQTRDNSSPVPEIFKQCMRAGITSNPNVLPITVSLLEGGAGKNPAPDYLDNLYVTVTPLAYEVDPPTDCSAL